MIFITHKVTVTTYLDASNVAITTLEIVLKITLYPRDHTDNFKVCPVSSFHTKNISNHKEYFSKTP